MSPKDWLERSWLSHGGGRAKCVIELHGCDDSTHVEMDLSESEYEIVRRLAEEITSKSKYPCQPFMTIGTVDEEDEPTS